MNCEPLDQSDTFSLDLEGGANQSEECGVKGHHPVSVQRHVHRYEALRERKRSFLQSRVCMHIMVWNSVLNITYLTCIKVIICVRLSFVA